MTDCRYRMQLLLPRLLKTCSCMSRLKAEVAILPSVMQRQLRFPDTEKPKTENLVFSIFIRFSF